MTVGFLTFADSHFLPLANVLVTGLKRFSRHPVQVSTINCDYLDYGWAGGKVTTNKIVVMDANRRKVGLSKITAILTSPFDWTVCLDADIVPNINVDDLADLATTQDWAYPLMPRHPMPPGDHIALLDGFGVRERALPYGQGCVMLISPRAKKWLSEAWKETLDVIELIGGEDKLPGYEEFPLNCLLWKTGASHQINYVCPKFGAYHSYAIGDVGEMDRVYPGHAVSWQCFHANKDVREAEAMLEDVTLHGNDFVERHEYRRRKPHVLSYAVSTERAPSSKV